MRILWLTSAILPQTARLLGLPCPHGLSWTVSLLDDLMADGANEICVLSRAGAYAEAADGRLATKTFPQHTCRYSPENEALFAGTIASFGPDVIHVFGTEYPHTLAMLRAAERAGRLDATLVSIQGLCSVYAEHYLLGLPPRVWRRQTVRDVLRRDSILRQQRVFRARGAFEIEALRLARHVAGRTDWDRACTRQIAPEARYHVLAEGMRPSFYARQWTLAGCDRRTLFMPQGNYPIKGMHLALEALAILKRTYPDVRLYTTGDDPRVRGVRRSYYGKYIARRIASLGLEEHVSYLGSLDETAMCDAFCAANAVISASTVENSPNGVCEAMLLGVPVVSSMVGGVASLITHGREGFLYPADAPYLLAEYASRLFDDDHLAQSLSAAARARAMQTHDRGAISARLMHIYGALAGGGA